MTVLLLVQVNRREVYRYPIHRADAPFVSPSDEIPEPIALGPLADVRKRLGEIFVFLNVEHRLL